MPQENLPQLKEGKVKILEGKKKIVPAFYPYTYSEIVSTMKEKRIGRPSTYARILEILKKRKYIKEVRKSFLISTKLGMKVFEFSQKNFKKYLDEETTRKLEEEMDKVEQGKESFENVLQAVYGEVKEIIRENVAKGIEYPNLKILN